MKEKKDRSPPRLCDLPACFGIRHSKKNKVCRDCLIVESCYAYKEM
jgi:hypothetical protein